MTRSSPSSSGRVSRSARTMSRLSRRTRSLREFFILSAAVLSLLAVGGSYYHWIANAGQSSESGPFMPPPFAARKFASREDEFVALVRHYLLGISPGMLQPEVLRAAYEGGLNGLDQIAYYIRIADNEAFFKGSHVNGRVSSMFSIIRTVLDTYPNVPDCEFIIVVNDGTKPQVPVFGVARHWASWTRMIPMPLCSENARQQIKSGFSNWDEFIEETIVKPSRNYAPNAKIPKAFFRGAFEAQTWALGSLNNGGKGVKPVSWKQINRGRLYSEASANLDVFDVGMTEKRNKRSILPAADLETLPTTSSRRFRDWMNYKVIINVGLNQDWTERLRSMLFMNSVILKHEAEGQEWFYPLLRPMVHYIPFGVNMDNVVEKARWAIDPRNERQVHDIVRQANDFANSYITEDAMTEYFFSLLTQYAAIQSNFSSIGRERLKVGQQDDEEDGFLKIEDNPFEIDESHSKDHGRKVRRDELELTSDVLLEE